MAQRMPPKHHHRAVFYIDPGDESLPGEEKGVGFTKCLHKKPWSESPFLIANEVICASLGQFIGLPIPPWCVTYSVDGSTWFSSLYFNFDDDDLPDVLPDRFWAELPNWLSAVVVFDIFVINADRHDQNLVVDDPQSPKLFRVIDHDQALLGGYTGKVRGIERLNLNKNTLGISDSTGGMRNDFFEEMTTPKYMNRWINRIKDMKSWFIAQCVDAARPYGISEQEGDAIKSFLIDRRDRLDQIIMANKHYFTGIAQMNIGGRLL